MLQNEMPEVMSKFKDFHDQVFKDGKLSIKEKRLIGLGMALALKCEYCIANHLKALKEMGAGCDRCHKGVAVAAGWEGGGKRRSASQETCLCNIGYTFRGKLSS